MSRFAFIDTWLNDIPIDFDSGRLYHQLANKTETLTLLGATPTQLSDQIKKLKSGKSTYYWNGDCYIELYRKHQGSIIRGIGVKPGITESLADFYSTVFLDYNHRIRVLPEQSSNIPVDIWKILVDNGFYYITYMQEQPGATHKRYCFCQGSSDPCIAVFLSELGIPQTIIIAPDKDSLFECWSFFRLREYRENLPWEKDDLFSYPPDWKWPLAQSNAIKEE